MLLRADRFAKMPALAVRPVASMAKPQVAKPAKVQKPAKVNLGAAAAAIAAAALLAAPVNAADIKTVVCASNPTAKICLKDSGKP